MSDSQEPSYYEIALTNTQVLVAFAILLACVLGAFLSGMWVARNSAPAVAAQQASADTGAATEGGAEGDQTFEFFDEHGGALDEPAASRLPQLPSSQEPVASEPDPSMPASEASEAAPATAGPDVPASEAAAQATEPTAAAPTPPARSAGADAGQSGVVIQVFSSSDEAQANSLVRRMKGDGLPAFLAPTEVDGRTLYRVRVGPFESRASAQKEANRIKRKYRLDTWIPREPTGG